MPVVDASAGLLSPTTNVLSVGDPRSGPRKGRVGRAVGDVASAKGDDLGKQAQEDTGWIGKLMGLLSGLSKSRQTKGAEDSGGFGKGDATTYLDKIAKATESLWNASQN